MVKQTTNPLQQGVNSLKHYSFYTLLGSFLTLTSVNAEALKGTQFEAPFSEAQVTIDGKAEDTVWARSHWYPMFENMAGTEPSADDFSGKFKLAWDQVYLYLLAEITDDVLFDQHADPLYFYWDDDCLEIFIDEDKSGGEHQFNYNAFAYHVALDNQAVDIGEKSEQNPEPFILLNDHVNSVWKRSSSAPHTITWEVSIKIFDDQFKPNSNHKPVKLHKGKELGFMLAYCDNDGSKHRESFVGSTQVKSINGDKNLGYKTADVFASLKLAK